MRILQRLAGGGHRPPIHGGPFTASIQIRFKKPANTAQTRLETRTPDPKLDLLAFRRRRLALILSLHSLIRTKKRGPFVSLQLLSRWAPQAGVTSLSGGKFVRKYSHVFEVFTHPIRRNLCCRFTKKFVELIDLDEQTSREIEEANLLKIRKILSLSVNGRIHLHAVRLIRRELGLPENFADSIIKSHSEIFRMVDLEILELIPSEEEHDDRPTFAAQVEKWRAKEYTEKWLSEFDTKYAFPINFPTGFKILPGFREKLRNWQRLPYTKPYERTPKLTARSCGGPERYEKRAVAVIHELLHLTTEKVVKVERLAHFRKDLGFQVNVRELLLKHPGIFYLSQRGNCLYVFLREAYHKGCLLHGDEIADVRRRMLELVLLGRRHTRRLEDTDNRTAGGDDDVEDGVVESDAKEHFLL